MKKKYILFIIACVTLVSANAQDITKDFFKSLPRKGTQTDSINNRGENDSIPYINPNGSSGKINQKDYIVDSSLIEPIIKYIFILRQDYSLYNKKEDALYGYDDQEQFGTTYSIGIKCNGFNIVSDYSIRPWEYDEKYEQFKSNKLVPQITRSWYRFVNDTISLGYYKLDTIVTAKKTIKDNSYYTSSPFVSTQEGFILNTEDTCKTGVLVWFVLEKGKLASPNAKIGLAFNSIDIEMFGSKTVIAPTEKEVLGGIFITMSKDNDKSLQLAGMVTKKDNSWLLEFPFKGFQNDNHEKPKWTGKLTKIEKTKGKSKK